MKTITLLIITMTLLFSTSYRPEEKGTLTISLSNIKKKGKINISIYKPGKKFPGDSKNLVKRQSLESTSSLLTITFRDISYGKYAVAIYQDVNGNGELDTKIFGIPTEPFAFSNNFRPKFGGPSFEKCEFEFIKDNQTIEIEMINSLFGGD